MSDVAFRDAEPETFDGSADHGLRGPVVREAWRSLLEAVPPPAPSDVADVDCRAEVLPPSDPALRDGSLRDERYLVVSRAR